MELFFDLSAVVIFLQFDKQDGTFYKFQKLFPKNTHDKFFWIIVENKIEYDYEWPIKSNIVKISGDNSAREFSGWDKGLGYVSKKRLNADLIIIANETVLVESLVTEQLVSIEALKFSKVHKVCLGVTNYSRSLCRDTWKYVFRKSVRLSIGKHFIHYWIRSNLMVFPFHVLKARKMITTYSSPDLFFPLELTPKVFREDAPCSDSLRQRILEWLTPDEFISKNRHWHSHFELESETYPKFRSKALAIINEKSLTAWLIRSDYRIFNILKVKSLLKLQGNLPNCISKSIVTLIIVFYTRHPILRVMLHKLFNLSPQIRKRGLAHQP